MKKDGGINVDILEIEPPSLITEASKHIYDNQQVQGLELHLLAIIILLQIDIELRIAVQLLE